MDTDVYYYGTDGEQVEGPLPLHRIAELARGRAIGVSPNRYGPWVALEKKIAEVTVPRAIGRAGPVAPVVREQDLPAAKVPAGLSSVRGSVAIIAWLGLAAGIFCIGLGVVEVCTAKTGHLGLVYTGLSSCVSGLLFLAVAEILKRLEQIVLALRQTASK